MDLSESLRMRLSLAAFRWILLGRVDRTACLAESVNVQTFTHIRAVKQFPRVEENMCIIPATLLSICTVLCVLENGLLTTGTPVFPLVLGMGIDKLICGRYCRVPAAPILGLVPPSVASEQLEIFACGAIETFLFQFNFPFVHCRAVHPSWQGSSAAKKGPLHLRRPYHLAPKNDLSSQHFGFNGLRKV